MGDKQPQSNATAFAGTIASRDISFTYDHATEPALRDVTLTIPEGECIVLCGASGCGKTSYTRVVNGLIPSFFHGVFADRQTTCGMDVETAPIDRLAPLFGSVFQNPKPSTSTRTSPMNLPSLPKTWDFQLKRLIAVSRL